MTERISAITELSHCKSQLLIEKCQQASHDLRSPLSSLQLVLSRIQGVPESHRELIQMSLKRINDIAKDLMFENRLATNSAASYQDLVPHHSLSKAVRDLVREKAFEFQNYNHIRFKFESHISEDLKAQIPSCHLQRILSNLINNAVEAMPTQQGVIKITLLKERSVVRLCLQDDGIGIPPELLPILGEKMISSGKTNLNQLQNSGNGIGVYSAKKMLKKYNGDLEINSQVGLGTTMTLILQIL